MIKVIQKAARVLELIGEGDGVGAAELSRRLEMNKATLSHLLATLTEVGFVQRGEHGGYAVGPALLALARAELRRGTLAGLAERAARELARGIGEMVTVATLHHGERQVLAKVSPEQSVAVDPRLEDRRSPFGTATGRALLAHAPADDLARALEGQTWPLPRWPAIGSRSELDAALAAIAAAGLASDVTSDGQAAQLAVPVVGPDGLVWAAIGASVPCYRLPDARRGEVIAALQAAAARLTAVLALQWGGESAR